jgi:RimJ/RimL family protein N-acetyltransferase
MATLIEIPTLRTERLVLRAFRADDLDGLAAMNADPDVQRFLYVSVREQIESFESVSGMP